MEKRKKQKLERSMKKKQNVGERSMKKKKKEEEEKKKQKLEEGPWSDLHKPLLELIASRLPPLDYVFRFRAVCRSWRSIPLPQSRPQQIPWLMYAGHRGNNSRRFLSLSDQSIYTLYLPELRDYDCLASADGWLLMDDGEDPDYYGGRFIINPISGENYRLIEDKIRSYHGLYAMPLPPTDHRCVVAIFQNDMFWYYHLWDDTKGWCFNDTREKFGYYYLDITYCKGKIYALTSKRSIECFYSFPEHRCELVEMDSSCIPNDESFLLKWWERVCWLVESLEELYLCVKIDHEDESRSLKLFRADLLNKAWVALEGLEDRFLLCSQGCSISIPRAKAEEGEHSAVKELHCIPITGHLMMPNVSFVQDRVCQGDDGRRLSYNFNHTRWDSF